MNLFGMLLRLVEPDLRQPNPHGIRQALAASNANSKALNAIFCGVSPDEFHRISHITVVKEAWEILEITYEGMKKVKDTKL